MEDGVCDTNNHLCGMGYPNLQGGFEYREGYAEGGFGGGGGSYTQGGGGGGYSGGELHAVPE